MENKSICRKVSSMLSLYIDNQVTYQESALIEEHLANCPECRAKYIYLQSLVSELKSSYKLVLEEAKKKQSQKIFSIREHEKFLNSLYPYLDNELNESECLEFKNYLAKSPNAQRQLKNMYKMKKELKNSYDRTKILFDDDFSQKIIRELNIKPKNNVVNLKNNLLSKKSVKIAVLFGLLIWGGYEAETYYFHSQKQQSEMPVVQKQNDLSENTESNR